MNPGIKVLLIENNPRDVLLIQEELGSVHFKTSIHLDWAECLQKGLDFLAANSVQAILLDLSLPDSQGLDTLQRVLACAPQMPVIVMTGLADEETGMKALQAGAQDYLIKGQVDGRLLARAIQYAIQRKQGELDLWDSEERIQNIIQHSSSVFYSHTPDHILTYVSPQSRAILDCEPEEAMIRWQTFLSDHPMNRQGIESTQRAIETGKRQPPYELEVITFKGRKIWVLVDESPVVKDVKTIIIVGSLTDITERKHTEAALEAGEKRFRAWIENSSDLITVVDLQGIIQYQSPSIKDLLGFAQEEVLGKAASDYIHPEDLQKMVTHFTETIQNSESGASAQCRIRHQDGSWRFMEAKGQIYIDEHGEVVALISSRDITERKLAENALQEKEHLLSEAQRIGRIGSWSYDIRRDLLTFSDEMYRLLDVQPEEFHHNSNEFLALVYPSDRPAASKWMADIKDGTQAKDLNFRLFHKDGELCYLHCTGVVEFDDATRPTRFIGTAQDVTERRVAEIQIDQQIKRLTALSEIDRAIISSVDQRYSLRVILSHLISQLQVDAADVLLFDPDAQTFNYAAGQGFRTKMMERVPLHMGESHAGRAAGERRMIRIPDLRETTNDLSFSKFVIAEGFVSYIAVPLVVKGQVKGVLEVFQRTLLQPYQEWLDFFNTLVGQTVIAIETTSLFEDLQASNRELMQAYEATIEGWSRAMDLRDRETEGHTQRVTKLTMELARSMGMDESKLRHVRRGALLHDIGKLGVPDQILFKADKLTVEEREMIKKHVDFAYEMLAPIPYLKPALNIPYFHHEKWDGTGYPLGLKGEQIPLEARIFTVVDVWDALLSDRPYRKAWSRDRVIEYIRAQSGTHFDPRVVECFLEVIKKVE
jgi:PAS domain S-box-containing protein/putative nucleotidyltransferase with HDIG domain